MCGFDLPDKDSKYLIVVVRLCMEKSSRARPRKLRLTLVTKSCACQVGPGLLAASCLDSWGECLARWLQSEGAGRQERVPLYGFRRLGWFVPS